MRFSGFMIGVSFIKIGVSFIKIGVSFCLYRSHFFEIQIDYFDILWQLFYDIGGLFDYKYQTFLDLKEIF